MAGVSAFVVLAIVAGFAVFAASKFGGPDAAQRAAQDREAARLAGQHYLEALATGDAHTALSLSLRQPATPQLLTDKALVDQLSATPITNITATNDPTPTPDVMDYVKKGRTQNGLTNVKVTAPTRTVHRP